MKLDLLAVTFLALGCACSTPTGASKPPAAPTGPTSAARSSDRPVLHAAVVHGPFQDEAAICQTIYSSGPDCFKRKTGLVGGPTSATAVGFGRVEIVEAWVGDHRCAILFEVGGRFFVHTAPGFCLSRGHSLYVPTVSELAFRDLDGVNPPDLVIVADVEIVRDETEGAPIRTTAQIPPLTMAIFCGRGAGNTPSCVEVTTKDPEALVATHGFSFE